MPGQLVFCVDISLFSFQLSLTLVGLSINSHHSTHPTPIPVANNLSELKIQTFENILLCRCGSKARCNIPVNDDLFGNPCPDTLKYVEVHYMCEPRLTR